MPNILPVLVTLYVSVKGHYLYLVRADSIPFDHQFYFVSVKACYCPCFSIAYVTLIAFVVPVYPGFTQWSTFYYYSFLFGTVIFLCRGPQPISLFSIAYYFYSYRLTLECLQNIVFMM